MDNESIIVEIAKIEYDVIFDDTIGTFVRLVNERLQDGWQLLGSVSVSCTETDDSRYIWFAQAVIRCK